MRRRMGIQSSDYASMTYCPRCAFVGGCLCLAAASAAVEPPLDACDFPTLAYQGVCQDRLYLAPDYHIHDREPSGPQPKGPQSVIGTTGTTAGSGAGSIPGVTLS